MSAAAHIPVLCAATVEHLLDGRKHGIFIDATFGRGGHARELLQRLDADSLLLVMDQDPAAIAAAQELAAQDARVRVAHGAFSSMAEHALAQGISKANGVLLDLGVSSPQLDIAERGFSLRADGPLDMRMNPTGMSAADWLNSASASDIAWVLRTYGEEKFARRIAARIVQDRPLRGTAQLKSLVLDAVPKAALHRGNFDPSRTFQAIRIHINDELGELQRVLPIAFEHLEPTGRLAVISFHSLEDRIVKRFFRDHAKVDQGPRRIPLRADQLPAPRARLVTGPVRPDVAEVNANPRSRSAVLRVLEKVA